MITEKHYAPWVRARQQQLENAVRLAWEKKAPEPAKPKTKLKSAAEKRTSQ